MAQQLRSANKSNLRIGIAHPSVNPETFTKAHIDRLHEVVMVIHNGIMPTQLAGGKVIMNTSGKARAIDGLSGILRGRNFQQEHTRRIADLLKEHRVDVVLAEYGYTASEIADACSKAMVPLVAHFFGKDAHGLEYLERYGNYKLLFQRASAIVVVSRTMEEHLLQLGAPREKLVYIACGVDVAMFHSADPIKAPPHFLAVGRFVEKKAPQLTLLAFAEVLRSRPDARLTMVGNGPLWETCEQLVKAFGLSEQIKLCGTRSPSEIVELKRRSRAFIQHSVEANNGDSEGTPVAIQEAMASGLPVISTRHAGIMDIITHGVEGSLCAPFDIRAMARHMIQLIDEPARAAEMGIRGRERAIRDFPVEQQVARLQKVLLQAAKGIPIDA
ncbi:MAG: glycosyltransferase [Bacteroidota bacterium]|nr:glycosyltransferase [Bacteroidota bacterium]